MTWPVSLQGGAACPHGCAGDRVPGRARSHSTPIAPGEYRAWTTLPALQQPSWDAPDALPEITARLAEAPGLVRPDEVRRLGRLLAGVAAGRYQVVQAGDCAEDPGACTPVGIGRKLAQLEALAGVMAVNSGRPVVRVGRIAGQFAKPRSRPTEWVGGVELPVYRGHLINGPEPDAKLRRADPARMLSCYRAAATTAGFLRRDAAVRGACPVGARTWTSHEALVLDYELPLLRRTGDTGELLLCSTHWPWIGDRTRQLDGAHVTLLAAVANPVACKVGPGMDTGELLALCDRLDPRRTPGRLTLISRMGAGTVADRLPPLVAAVRREGHPVIWLCDPMHANTITVPTGAEGLKTRLVTTVAREVRGFLTAVGAAGGIAGGLHLETTPDQVTECVTDASRLHRVGEKYTSLCDPRLNPGQALHIAACWH
ncbi:3-deoxy-7-phosphoheptulonate synthase [Streptacidiphilus sp. EB129]|uniref:3-deoxy-7-phosphoheptulonate synthase n=1 Tax=Streptacidiphilus sp. EB129 TaxID=3156262 RepID=UPI0035190B7D